MSTTASTTMRPIHATAADTPIDGRPRRGLLRVAALMAILFVTGCPRPAPPPPPPPPAPPVPTDAQDACPLPLATFAGWFQSGAVTLNGAVNPANGLVSLTPNCGFYAWSEQMFL